MTGSNPEPEELRKPYTLDQPVRRDFLRWGSLAALASAFSANLCAPWSAGAARPQQTEKGKRIVKAQIGNSIRIPNCSGDVWTTTWADDDDLYCATDDTTGFNKACNSNLGVQRITGGPPPNIHGETINAMSEFGKEGELKEDVACWKASGLTCVDGALYLAVSRHYYDGVGDKGSDSAHHFWVQETWDASIVKSTDHGKTWSEAPKLGHAMFKGRLFSNPFFVQYGRDGNGDRDGAADYVYAISNDGTWNNGNWMTLGRVSRAHRPT